MSPSLQTMGFFMSDINFCNTKEQLTHLGEVVTGKVDGSPTGADIDESTLPYTGQVRKTLPALEQEYLEAIQGAGGVSVGTWTSGVTTFTKYNEYAVYNGIPYKPRTSTPLPYVAQGSDPTVAPDDANVQPYQEITEAQVVALVESTVAIEIPSYSDIQSNSVSDMVLGITAGGEIVTNDEGQVWSVGRSKYLSVLTSGVSPNGFNIIQSISNPLVSLSLIHSNIIDIDEWGVVADGVTSDKAAISNIISHLSDGYSINSKGKEIFLGDVTDSDVGGIFNINQIDNLSFIGKPRWKINNTMTGAVGELKIAPVFKFTDCENLTLTCDASGDQYDVNSPHGPAFYYVENDTKDTSGLYIDCNATNAVAACMIEQKAGSNKALYDVIGTNGGDNITYAHRPFQSGHNATLTINAKNHARSYYPIGVSNQQVTINSENNKRVNDVLIKCYVGETSNINVHINQKGSTSSEWPVLIEHENLNTSNVSSIKEIDITLNTDKQYSGANPEFFAFRQRVTGGATAQTSLNTTDEIRLTLLGNQVSSANPKIAFLSGIATNNKGTFHTNMTDDVIDTRGFTFKKSDSIKIKRRGDLSSFTKQLYMQQINRSGVMILLTVSAFSDYTTGVGFVQTYGIRAFLDDLGGGVVNNFNKQYGWNDSGAPAVSVSFSNFNLVVDIASNPAYENSNSEICVTAQFISNI